MLKHIWIHKLAWKGLKAGKVRGVLTIVSVAIMMMVIATTLNVGISIMKIAENKAQSEAGTYAQYGISNPDTWQIEQLGVSPYIKSAGYQIEVGTVHLNDQELPMVYINSSEWENHRKPVLFAFVGSYPQTDRDIMLSESLLQALGINEPSIGMNVPLSCTIRKAGEEETSSSKKDYILTGYYTSPLSYVVQNQEMIYVSKALADEYGKNPKANGYAFLTLKQNPLLKDFKILSQIVNNAASETSQNAKLTKLGDDLGLSANQPIHRIFLESAYTVKAFSQLLTYALIIVPTLVCGFFLIYDCFQLSVVKEIRQYGMLMAVGITPKQLQSMILWQGLILYSIGAIIGLFLSMLGAHMISGIYLHVDNSASLGVLLTWSPTAVLFALVIVFLAVLISQAFAYSYAKQISIIDAIRYNGIHQNLKFWELLLSIVSMPRFMKDEVRSWYIWNRFRATKNFYLSADGLAEEKLTIKKERKGKVSANENKKLSAGNIYQMALSSALQNIKSNFHIFVSLCMAGILFLTVTVLVSNMDPEKFVAHQLSGSDFEIENLTCFDDKYFGKEPPQHVIPKETIDHLSEDPKVKSIDYTEMTWIYEEMNPSLFNPYFDYFHAQTGADITINKDEKYMRTFMIGISTQHLEQLRKRGYIDKVDIADFEAGKVALLSPEVPEVFPEEFAIAGYVSKSMFADVSHIKSDMDFSFPIKGFVIGGFKGGIGMCLPPMLYVHKNGLQQYGDIPVIYKLEIDIEPDAYLSIRNYLQNELKGNPAVRVKDKIELMEQRKTQQRIVFVVGYAFAMMIAVIGVLSFVNMTMIGIGLRKTEFAVLRGIGMAASQLQKMLMLEGLIYAGMLIVLTSLLGYAIMSKLYDQLEIGYARFEYPYLAQMIISIITIIFLTYIPSKIYEPEKKKSISRTLQDVSK